MAAGEDGAEGGAGGEAVVSVVLFAACASFEVEAAGFACPFESLFESVL